MGKLDVGGSWELSVLSDQFLCKSKTVLKNKLCQLKIKPMDSISNHDLIQAIGKNKLTWLQVRRLWSSSLLCH